MKYNSSLGPRGADVGRHNIFIMIILLFSPNLMLAGENNEYNHNQGVGPDCIALIMLMITQ